MALVGDILLEDFARGRTRWRLFFLMAPCVVVSAGVREVDKRLRRLHAQVQYASPGWTLLRLTKWIYSPKTFNAVFAPTISDMQHEHMVALAEGKPWKARWVTWRGRYAICCAGVAQLPVSALRLFVALWKAS
jgi:hypothetical protein